LRGGAEVIHRNNKIEEKINADRLCLTILEYERFLTLFIFVDIKEKGYKELIKNYFKT
jgi:hypothetical protein